MRNVNVVSDCVYLAMPCYTPYPLIEKYGKAQFKCVGARAETRFRPSAKRTSPIKSAGLSVQ
jgi:hypothetical protein